MPSMCLRPRLGATDLNVDQSGLGWDDYLIPSQNAAWPGTVASEVATIDEFVLAASVDFQHLSQKMLLVVVG